MAQAKTIRWQHDGRNEDNTSIAAEAFRGWTLEVNGEEAVSVPRSWETDGEYAVSTTDMPVFEDAGAYQIRMALITTGGPSDWTAPVTFTLAESKPKAPFGLAVA